MNETSDSSEQRPKCSPSGVLRLDFARDTAFQTELRRRVDEFFQTTRRRQRDCWQMYLKTAIILGCFVASYVLLVFAAHTFWQAMPMAILLGLNTAGIGFDIQHDGGHQACSRYPLVNRLMAMTLDVIGGSSYVWHWKHTVIHHMYTNIAGYDPDIDLGWLGRMSPHHKRRWYFRYQHLYFWLLYAMEAMHLQFYSDFHYVILGRLGKHRIARPHGWELVGFVAGKVIFFSLAFAIPMLFHPVWTVLFYYVVVAAVVGLVLSLVFVLPHCAGDVDFPLPRPDTGAIDIPWAVHQATVTLDFARHNRILTWLLGGLNYHKEHHLFPLICHVHYPAISNIVQRSCQDMGIPYKEHRSFFTGLAAHYHWLKQMGAAD